MTSHSRLSPVVYAEAATGPIRALHARYASLATRNPRKNPRSKKTEPEKHNQPEPMKTRKDMTQEEWEDAVWAREQKEIQYWTEELRSGSAIRDIRIVSIRGCAHTHTTIISDVSSGDAYLVMTDIGGETLEKAVKTKWLDSEVTKAIAYLYQNRTSEFDQ